MARAPGRPTQKEGPAITREGLLDVAARVIAARQFAGASIRGIAAEAGVSHGTVQHHFPTKDALWRALVDEVFVPRMQALRPAQPPPLEGIDRDHIAAVVTARIRGRITNAFLQPGLPGAVLMDSSDGSEGRLAYLAKALGGLMSDQEELIHAVQNAGKLRRFDVDALKLLVGIGLACLAASSRASRLLIDVDLDDPAVRDRMAEGIADILLHGLLPRDDADAQ